MNTLTSENRNRHSLAMRNILNNAFSISGGFTKVNLNTGEPMIGAYNSRLILTKVVSLALRFILIFPNSNHLISILS